MSEKEKAITGDAERLVQVSADNHQLKSPKLFAWMASLATVLLIILTTLFLPRGDNAYLRGAGVLVLVLASVFIFAPFSLLRKQGRIRGGKTYMQTNTVVDQGLYAITRHPQYLGYMFFACGFALLSQHWAAVLLATVAVTLFYLQAMKEEHYCLTQLGEPYEQYLGRVPRFNLVLGIMRLLQGSYAAHKGEVVKIEKAALEDIERLTNIQTRTFDDDNKLKPPGCSLEGPPGYNSVDWNAEWIEKTPYYKILFDDQIVGGVIVFEMGEGHYELGRIYVDPDFQNRGIGQQAMRLMFRAFPEAKKWTLGTPSWAIRNQHFYEKMGFVKVRETEVDPYLGWSGIEYELEVGDWRLEIGYWKKRMHHEENRESSARSPDRSRICVRRLVAPCRLRAQSQLGAF